MPQIDALGEDPVLVDRDQLAEHRRRQLRAPAIVLDGRLPGITLCGTTLGRRALGGDLLGGLAERQRLRLGEEVGHEQVVHARRASWLRLRRSR